MRNWNREYLDFAKDKGWRQRNDPIQLALYSDTLQTFRLAAQGKTAGPPAARRTARTHRHLLRPAAVLVRAAGRSRHRPGGLSAQRDHAAADGDVPLLGLAERLAAPDPQPQLPACEPGDRAGRRHRRRRLVLGREPVGQGALHAPLQRGGRARHGLDLERDRQGRRRLATGARRRRGAQGLPAQPPDHRRAAVQAAPSGATTISNSDPITGQAGWYDVRVRIRPAEPEEAAGVLPADRRHAGGARRRRQGAPAC